MAERERIQKSSGERSTETDQNIAQGVGSTAAKGTELKAEIDDLLDEIDEVLEENAEEFVRSYIQKGGE